jgi:hypothetical protein
MTSEPRPGEAPPQTVIRIRSIPKPVAQYGQRMTQPAQVAAASNLSQCHNAVLHKMGNLRITRGKLHIASSTKFTFPIARAIVAHIVSNPARPTKTENLSSKKIFWRLQWMLGYG